MQPGGPAARIGWLIVAYIRPSHLASQRVARGAALSPSRNGALFGSRYLKGVFICSSQRVEGVGLRPFSWRPLWRQRIGASCWPPLTHR